MTSPSTATAATTKLPSIQSMLEGISLSDEQHVTRTFVGHRRHASEQGAFTMMKSKAPTLEPKIEHLLDLKAAANTANTLSDRSSTYYPRISEHHSPRNLHSRSFSDYTHPYSSCSPPRTTGTHLAPLQHRRAVSTNTLDIILQPLMQRPLDFVPPLTHPSSSTSSITTSSMPEEYNEGYMSDETHISTHSERSTSPNPTTRAGTKSTTAAVTSKSDSKYICTYCSKGFSRPSSLRIHTYSHTGERPFECPEVGCSRKFSVQSNMRRHLRVHRLGRPLKRNGGLISPADRAQLINKPLAAKPITTSSNWSGVTVYPS
ncbi:hypothetical protein [Parasitella parasitica]|uniref:C2H2-type domain-containing protein n=1 Tax=Parasitella parasitica TaxID=35722 RepID=A0A0B7NRD7_9FUNG|nr:hypothetical protein [Parasitella parasitica]